MSDQSEQQPDQTPKPPRRYIDIDEFTYLSTDDGGWWNLRRDGVLVATFKGTEEEARERAAEAPDHHEQKILDDHLYRQSQISAAVNGQGCAHYVDEHEPLPSGGDFIRVTDQDDLRIRSR